MKKETSLQKLMKIFKLGINKDFKRVDPQDKIRPLDGKFKPENFPPFVQKYWDYWLNNCHSLSEDYKNMVTVWEDMDLLYYNSPLIKRAIDLTADETIQADLSNNCVGIEASPKAKEFLTEFHDNINLQNKLRPTAEDVIQYGNTGWVLSQDENSIEDIIQIDIYDFKAVLEFTPYEVRQMMEKKDKFFIEYSAKERIDKLIQSIMDKDNYASYFKKFVLGYQIADLVLPPWKFLHFKNNTSKSPFNPFGVPTFIHAVSAYRQYDAAMTLQMTLRAAKLPIEKYSITASNVVDPVSKLQFVIDFLRNVQNAGFGDTRKEEKGIGETIFTIKDLFDYDVQALDLDLSQVADLEMLYNELIISTGLPRNLIDPNDSGFGDSGIALAEKFKPFARQVYRNQSIMLDNITQLDKIQMTLSGKFSEEEMDFILTMPYPESQTNPDVISNQKDLIDLADAIMEMISTKFLNEEPIPKELAYSVISQILPYSQEKIDGWLNVIKNMNPSNVEDASNEISESMQKILRNKVSRPKLMEAIKSFTLSQKVSSLKEGVQNDKHYFTSSNKYEPFKAELLNEWSIDDVKNILKEETKVKVRNKKN